MRHDFQRRGRGRKDLPAVPDNEPSRCRKCGCPRTWAEHEKECRGVEKRNKNWRPNT